jgi:hypothetical protein
MSPGVLPELDVPQEDSPGCPPGSLPGVPRSSGHRLFFWGVPTPKQTSNHHIANHSTDTQALRRGSGHVGLLKERGEGRHVVCPL